MAKYRYEAEKAKGVIVSLYRQNVDTHECEELVHDEWKATDDAADVFNGYKFGLSVTEEEAEKTVRNVKEYIKKHGKK